MNKKDNAFTAAILINTIFQEYRPGELNSSGELVRSRTAKFIRQQINKDRKLSFEIIKKTEAAWISTINHFAKEMIAIEAKTTIMAIYNYFSDDVSKYAKVTDKHIEKFMISATDNAEAEHNSSVVVDYIVKELGIEKKISALSGRARIIKGNMVIEGKNIKEEFLK